MKLVFKIILGLLIGYFSLGMIFYLYSSFTRVDDVYQAEKRAYDRSQECYECFIGERSGICPQISPASPKKDYPSAQESIEVTLSCYWYESWDNGFHLKVPLKSLAHSFRKNWGSSWQGYFLWTFVVLTFGQVPLG